MCYFLLAHLSFLKQFFDHMLDALSLVFTQVKNIISARNSSYESALDVVFQYSQEKQVRTFLEVEASVNEAESNNHDFPINHNHYNFLKCD